MGTYTLLRYPGGKFWATKKLLPFFLATGETSLVSPFFGGGAIEFALLNKGWTVRGYDNFGPVVNFWQCALENPGRIADIVEMYRPMEFPAFKAMQQNWEQIDGRFSQAAVYYVLNRTSHSGIGFLGGITKWSADGTPDDPRLKDSTIKKLRGFVAPGLTVDKADFAISIRKNPKTLMYLDPPYVGIGERLYKQERFNADDIVLEAFDHELLAFLLRRQENWILSYNDHDVVRELYDGYPTIELSWAYGHQRTQGNELLIFSKNLSHLTELAPRPLTSEEESPILANQGSEFTSVPETDGP